MGDTQYHIRIRASGPGDGGTAFHHMKDHRGAPPVLTVRGKGKRICDNINFLFSPVKVTTSDSFILDK